MNGEKYPNSGEPNSIDFPSIDEVNAIANSLERLIASYESAVIAFSGGVDSAVVAAAAYMALGVRSVAITGIGDAVAATELECACSVAESIGIRHVEVPTLEIQDYNYVRNDARRCYHCKSNLYGALSAWMKSNGFQMLLSGTNVDDLSDYRPGLDAAREYGVVAPLAELTIDKQQVRALAKHYRLSIADKPAAPCLASRIAYGQSVTIERLRRIESAEQFLKSLGFHDVRVRVHDGELARIELKTEELVRASEPELRNAIARQFQLFGFQFVTIDMMGRQSGSLNRMLPILQ